MDLSEMLRTMWLVQASVFIPCVIFLIHRYYTKGSKYFKHIAALACAHSMLLLIDVYTIWFERYPTMSAKGGFMLLSFLVADFGLLSLILKKSSND